MHMAKTAGGPDHSSAQADNVRWAYVNRHGSFNFTFDVLTMETLKPRPPKSPIAVTPHAKTSLTCENIIQGGDA